MAATGPSPYPYVPTTALLIVDAQNDFCDPAGSLSVAGAAEAITTINAHVAAAGAAGAPVFLTADWHPPVTPHFVTGGGRWPVHCVAGTWGARFVEALHVPPGAVVVRKGVGGEDGYSGFGARVVGKARGGEGEEGGQGDGEKEATDGGGREGDLVDTGLAAALTTRNVTALVVVGVAGDVCVRATALDARARGWPVTLPRGGVAYVDPTAVGRVERELTAAGVTLV
ncbi:hypothetical protein MMPV_005099 [Pyropia vietnamensis]